jgi:membrane-bound metal-dependent hydrolase YbcI (DUF457 family)
VNRRHLEAGADPFVHALLAAAVVAPLGRRPMVTAVVAGTLIDVDHIVAARSVRPGAMLTLRTRPRSHTLLATLAAAALGTAAGGPIHGWAGFAGLTSHLLRDAGDDAAATPLLWPFRPPGQIGRTRAAVGIGALALGSVAISRRAARAGGPTSAAAAGTGGAPPHPRTG